ncbi:MAG TPA: phytanoyl-CoA dioxygenase family protein [Chloroflexota bacterium]|nr:phytanoyl-CoA dioxygenase family protein [Chloroflexota bacterium]
MNDEERYLFDLQGFLVLKGVLSQDEVGALNRLIDAQNLPEPGESVQSQRFGGFLSWGQPFRDVLDHPRVMPYLKELLDPAVRLDHYYGIYMKQGTEGLKLHGGGTPYDRPEYYHFRNGQMFNGLTVVTWALSDVPAGQGGFACIPGSHKANYACPRPIRNYESNPGCVVQVPMQAGDVLIFTEALTHGTHPWTTAHQRRSLLLKYCPGHMAWGGGYTKWPAELLEQLTATQRLLFEAPYFHQRKEIGDPEAVPRSAY